MISLIVARAHGGAIGKDNDIPWSAPEDWKFFQRETRGGAMIMGRNTWDSLPVKPLKNRLNIVVSSQEGLGEITVSSVEDAVKAAHDAGYHRIYGMGGAGIYKAMLPLADRLLITEVDIDVPDAQIFFPEFDAKDWHLNVKKELRVEAPACVMHEYLRKRS